jgi:UDP-N-acetylglucosamine acyltransferase
MANLVHDTAIIGPGVELGDENVIGPFAVLTGPCRIGDRNWIGAHAVIGAAPEITGHEKGLPWGDEPRDAGVVIGDDTTIREHASVHRGTRGPTRVGNGCFLMTKTHLSHDCDVADGVTLSMAAVLAGHVQVGAGANLGVGTVVHQWRVIGPGAMLGMGSVVTRDVLPYGKAYGSPARLRGVNEVGMRRRGIGDEDVTAVVERYGADGSGAAAGVGSWTPPEALRPAWDWWLARTGN